MTTCTCGAALTVFHDCVHRRSRAQCLHCHAVGPLVEWEAGRVAGDYQNELQARRAWAAQVAADEQAIRRQPASLGTVCDQITDQMPASGRKES